VAAAATAPPAAPAPPPSGPAPLLDPAPSSSLSAPAPVYVVPTSPPLPVALPPAPAPVGASPPPFSHQSLGSDAAHGDALAPTATVFSPDFPSTVFPAGCRLASFSTSGAWFSPLPARHDCWGSRACLPSVGDRLQPALRRHLLPARPVG
jgi:hypothetical protein